VAALSLFRGQDYEPEALRKQAEKSGDERIIEIHSLAVVCLQSRHTKMRGEVRTKMQTRPVDVLVIAPHGSHGGQEEWLLKLLDATTRLRVRVLLLQDGPLRGVIERRGLSVEVLPVGTRPWSLVVPILRLSSRLRANRPDVVLANGVKAQFVAGPATRLAGVPLVFARHDHSFENKVALLSRLADAVVGTSEEVLAAVHRGDAQVLYPPLPAPSLDRSVARERLRALGSPSMEGLLLGMLTRLVRTKGVEDAIRALALPAASGWGLTVLGGDDQSDRGERQRLTKLAATLGVADRVHLAGFVPAAGDLVKSFDAVAVLTRAGGNRGPGGEGFGMAALEAMAAGVPVVAVGGGAIERRLAGQAGIVVPSSDPDAVAAALGILTDPAVREELGAAGRRLARCHPDSVATARRLSGVLAEAARRPGAGLVADEPVSVVVPVHNEEHEITALVTALTSELRLGDELIVIDDASSDRTLVRLKAWQQDIPQLKVLSLPSNRGAAAARNAGVVHARNEFIVCTDAGNDIPAGWLDSMRTALCDTPPPDLVAGAYQVSSGTTLERAMAASLYPDPNDVRCPNLMMRVYSRVFGRSFSPERPAGRSIAFRREAWHRVGGFREDLRSAEDTAFGLAVSHDGHCVIQTDAPVTWRQHSSIQATARMFASYGRGDGIQGERVVLLRNAVRACTALVIPALLTRGNRASRAAAIVAGSAYISVPIWKLRRDPTPLRTAALVPIALATKDFAKAYGCARGLLEAQFRRKWRS
jgi:glycosyltransferase involved in cell wall biosynthesis